MKPTDAPRPLPHVVVHVAVSLDGKTTGFAPDIGTYYRLAAHWNEDATLTGSRTILASPDANVEDAPDASGAWPASTRSERPLLVVIDADGQVRCWGALSAAGLWKAAVSLGSERTDPRHGEYLRRQGVEPLTVGDDRVDLHQALVRLHADFGVRVLRVDSGGALNGALLDNGLVSEVSLVVHPVLVGGADTKDWLGSFGTAAKQPAVALRPLGCTTVAKDLLWIRYRVLPPEPGRHP